MTKNKSKKDTMTSFLEAELNKSSVVRSKRDEEELDNLFLSSGLTKEDIVSLLSKLASEGNLKAIELMGKHLQMFDNKQQKEDTLIDVFADEGTLEDNLLKYLDILEDKYQDELADSVTILKTDPELYLTSQEKEIKDRAEQRAQKLKELEDEEKRLNHELLQAQEIEKALHEKLRAQLGRDTDEEQEPPQTREEDSSLFKQQTQYALQRNEKTLKCNVAQSEFKPLDNNHNYGI